jgi:hypothetical protein
VRYDCGHVVQCNFVQRKVPEARVGRLEPQMATRILVTACVV